MRTESFSIKKTEAVETHLGLMQKVYKTHLSIDPPLTKIRSELKRPALREWAFVQTFLEDAPITSVAVGSPAGDSRQLPEKTGFAGFFISRNNENAAKKTFDHAVRKLAEKGKQTVYGPINGDTWHRYRFTLGPAPEDPFFLEPVNPSYAPSLWTASGFAQDQTYHSRKTTAISQVRDQLRPVLEETRERGIRFRTFDTNQFERELSRLYALSCSIFADNYLYTTIDEQSFKQKYRPVKSLLLESLTCFAMNDDGREIGFAFAIPDYDPEVLRGERPSSLDLPETVNIKTAGVRSSYRNQNVGNAMMARIYSAIDSLNAKRANLCLIQDGNYSERFDRGTGEQFRRYALFKRSIQ